MKFDAKTCFNSEANAVESTLLIDFFFKKFLCESWYGDVGFHKFFFFKQKLIENRSLSLSERPQRVAEKYILKFHLKF